MTPNEASTLLGICAAFDNRQPNPNAAQAWAVALTGYPFADCRDAVVAHYRKTSEWIMPSHVIAAVKQVRVKRISDAGHLLIPPPGLTEPEERAWLGVARRRVADGEAPEDVSPQQLGTSRPLELVGPAHVDTADAVRDLRAAHAEAKRVLQEAAAEEEADRARKQDARESARAADREAIANRDETEEPA